MTATATRTPPSVEPIVDADDLDRRLADIAGRLGAGTNAARQEVLATLKSVNAAGRCEARRLLDDDGGGLQCAERISYLEDTLVRAIFRYAGRHVYPVGSPSRSERIAIAAVGGYGRGTLAPGSDVDLLFLLPYKNTAWTEQVCEWALYMLWDMGQRVGHSTRSVEECLRQARADMTIRTALLEARFICGDEALYDDLAVRFEREVVRGSGPEFIAAKLAERDQRHRKDGDTRYLVEPNVKEGKGGLRDLNTLFWIAKYFYRVPSVEQLVGRGVLSKREYVLLLKAEDFLWAVRCRMHFLAGKAEERLSFDIQRDVAESLGYQDHPGLSAVERFMKHYFLVAKDVGDLTRILCAALEDEQAKAAPGLTGVIGRFTRRVRKIPGTIDFVEDNGRINIAGPDVFKADPVNIIRMFHIAGIRDLEFHPDALKRVTRSLRLINAELRENQEANGLFMAILTSRTNPALILRRMNEAGVLGRFIPEFGKIVSMMQFSMYHHFTVDEHLLRSVEVLSRIDAGEEAEKHPLTTRLMQGIDDREALYVAVLLHDIAKGRPEDHSIAGAKVARKLCPRLGLTSKQTELVAWLIEQHLTMSMTAQSRDLNDRKTIDDFAALVQSLDRLKMLQILTCCDIRAVGPGVWNGWKGQLLRTLYFETEVVLSGGFSAVSRKRRAAMMIDRLREALAGWGEAEREAYLDLHYEAYLLSVSIDDQVRHAGFIRETDRTGRKLATMVRTHAFHAITEITVLAPDHPRLLTIIAGACAAAGANIADAQIFTTSDGRALDTILINREFPDDADELRRAGFIGTMIEEVLAGRKRLPDVIASKARGRSRAKHFSIAPAVSLSNTLSNRFTVIEVECLDRAGVLSEMTAVLSDLSLDIASAHITTFGEKVVDTFYVTDLFGHKITNENRQAHIAARLKAVMSGEGEDVRDRMPSGIIAAPAASKQAEAATRKARVELS